MRAAVLVEPRRFEIELRTVPEIKPDEVLIEVARCGICGTDTHIHDGGFMAHRLPLVPGHEFSGRVVKAGSQSGVAEGIAAVVDINHGCGRCYYCRRNELMNCPSIKQIGIDVDGGFAEYVRVPGHLVIEAPETTPFDVLALTEPVACVVHSATRSGFELARSVLIIGAGPIGNLHVQMQRLTGAAPIIVAETSADRARLAKAAGADAVVNDPQVLMDVVHSLTEGRGVDLAIESVGATALYETAQAALRPGGHLAAFGLPPEGSELKVDLLTTVLRENSLMGSVAGPGQAMHHALSLLSHGRFDTSAFTSATYALEDISTAFETLPERPQDLKTQIILNDNL
ncbi:dehydrogenase [Loktanella sp. IMCC34160]|nr:dehydrogenase [Loktanella sp. IMCC34160]